MTGIVKVIVEYNQKNIFAQRIGFEGTSLLDILTSIPFGLRTFTTVYMVISFAISAKFFIDLKRKAMNREFTWKNKLIIILIYACVVLKCIQLIVINVLTMVRCLKDVCGMYSLEAIWTITRGMMAPTRDATELALICSMIRYQYRKNL